MKPRKKRVGEVTPCPPPPSPHEMSLMVEALEVQCRKDAEKWMDEHGGAIFAWWPGSPTRRIDVMLDDGIPAVTKTAWNSLEVAVERWMWGKRRPAKWKADASSFDAIEKAARTILAEMRKPRVAQIMGAPDLDFRLYEGVSLLEDQMSTVEMLATRASAATAAGNKAGNARGWLIADLVRIFLAAGCDRPLTREQLNNAPRPPRLLPPRLEDSPLLACVMLVLKEIGEDTKGASRAVRTLLGRLPR